MARFAHSFSLLLLYIACVRGALGPISTAQPVLAGGNVANVAPPGPFFQGHTPPFPTNAWWTGFAAPPQNALVAGPAPYASLCTNDSFHFGLSEQRSFDGTSVHQPAQLDLGVSFVEHASALENHRAAGWDSQSVSIDFVTPGSAAAMRVFLVQGAPYMTFRFNASTPLFTSLAGSFSKVDQTSIAPGGSGLTVTGTKFTITNDAGAYLLYSLDGPLTLAVDSPATTITASAPFSGVLRLAKLDNAAHEATLDAYVANYPTGVTTDYTFNGDQANLIFKWDVVGDASKLLMLTYPHHRRAMVSPNFLPLNALAHMSLKGWMYPALGATWTMQYTLSSIDFNAPRAPDASCMASLIKGLEYEVAHLGDPELPGDFYNWGNHLAAVARLGLIADEVQRPDLVELVVTHLKGTFAPWLNAAYTNVQAAYETNWGGVVNKAGAGSVFVDFGNGYYNDHNLQYGYFLNIGAVIAKFDPAWLKQKNGVSTNEELLSFIARDVANPSSQDPFFPVVRHRDWFAGHSWASGVANGAGSRDQESSTEGVNAYYGTLLYAIVTGQKDLEQFARLLVATEQIGSQTYWHLYPDADPNGRDEPYPEAAARALITMGNVEDEQAGAWLFWGAERVEIAAIQILPVTPINEALYDARWVQNVLNYTAGELADPAAGDAWKSVIYLAYSNFDPHKAAQLSTTLSSWGSGNSFSNQVYFIATRPNPKGDPICTGVQLNPEGIFIVQDVDTGLYITSTSAQPALVPSAAHASDASLFQLSFMPGGGSFQNFVTGLFVTANPNANIPVSSLSGAASTWEILTAVPVSGAGNDSEAVYNLRSGANSLWVDSSSGELVNSATTQSSASRFRIITPPPPQGNFLLQDSQSGLFVQSSGNDPTLSATASSQGDASVFMLSPNDNGATIQLLSTGQFVSATPSTDDPLQAIRNAASTWETFIIAPKKLSTDVTIAAVSNGHFVVAQPNGDLVNAVPSPSNSTGFRLVRPGNPLGPFFIQDVSSSKFLSSTKSAPKLTASAATATLGTLFLLASDGSVQNLQTGGFVAAVQIVQTSSNATKNPQSFTVTPKALTSDQFIVGTADGKSFFVTDANGNVAVKATAASSASAFRFVPPTSPRGSFLIQDAQTGRFVSSSAGAPDLVARESSGTTGTWFNISDVTVNGNTAAAIQNTVTQQFVTADPAGVGSLSAARGVASLWEMYTLWPKSGTPDQFVIQAGANNLWVTTGTSGGLVNNAANYRDASGFRIVGAQNPVGIFALQDSKSGLWVTSPAGRQQLLADGSAQSAATPFVFALLDDPSGGGSIQNAQTQQFVSADPSGATPAAASRGSPSTWETWVVRIHVGSPDLFTIQAINNNEYLVSAKGGIFNNASSVGDATLFRFVPIQ